MKKLYGVFVAVDKYDPASRVSNLSGCKNDIASYKETFSKKYASELELNYKNNIIQLADETATYDNVVKAFDVSNFKGISKDDVFLFIYSGHGSQERHAIEFDKEFTEKKSETIVLHDSRCKGNGKDLSDKEIAVLLNHIGKKCDNIIVIFDCCHSGSGTRNINDYQLGSARQLERDEKNKSQRDSYKSGQRSFDSYLNGDFPSVDGVPHVPYTKHLFLGACDKKEKAIELLNPQMGAFSHMLTECLYEYPTEDYITIFDIVRGKMIRNSLTQQPRMETHEKFNASQSFLSHFPKNPSERKYIITREEDDLWGINLGAIHGIPTNNYKNINFQISTFKGNDLGVANVDRVGVNYSNLKIQGVSEELEELQALLISPIGEGQKIDLQIGTEVNEKIKEYFSSDDMAALPFSLESNPGLAKYSLKIDDNQISIIDLQNKKTLVVYINTYKVHGQELLSRIKEHLIDISTWEQKHNIKNLKSAFSSDDFDLSFITKRDGQVYTNEEYLEFELAKDDDKIEKLEFEIQIVNNKDFDVKCSLLYFSDKFGISPIVSNKVIAANATSIVYAKNLILYSYKPESTDIFKIFVTVEEEFEPGFFIQSGITAIKQFRQYGPIDFGKRDFERGKARDLDEGEPNQEAYAKEWMTKELKIKLNILEHKLHDNALKLSESISISAKGGFKAKLHPTNTTSSSRSLDNYSIVPQYIAANEGFELISVSARKRSLYAHNSIELRDYDHEEELEKNPISITLNNIEGADHVVALTYDGEDFIPLDLKAVKDGSCELEVHTLPENKLSSRSITQAIRLFFVKIKGNHINESTHILELHENGEVINEPKKVKELLKDKSGPLLVVHGIMGNTKDMVNFGKSVVEESEKYDALLSFNYENLNTPIHTTANELDTFLKDAGVGDNKKITILAHSMGGLVSRFLIEMLGGKTYVEKLIQAGTPNLGSRFAHVGSKYIFQWLPVIFYTINVIRDPKKVTQIFALATGKYKANTTLNQMTYEHEDQWLKLLNKAVDPAIPYKVAQGSLQEYVNEDAYGRKFINKIYKLGGKLFYPDEDSDLVVSESSIKGIPDDRNHLTEKVQTKCIHMNYFTLDDPKKKIRALLLDGE